MSWPYSNNPFKSQHNSPFVKFIVILNYTMTALKAVKDDDPEYQAMLELLTPFWAQYEELYAIWLAAKGPSEGSVEAFAEILRQESAQVHLWDMGIQQKYLNTTIEWKKMFPDKLSGFYAPTTEEGKVIEVQAFVNRTLVYPMVTTISEMAIAYYKIMEKGLQVKDSDLKALTKASTNLKDYQDLVADQLFGILGSLMNFHQTTPIKTETFFDLEEMRTKPASEELKLKVNEYQYYLGPHQLINLPINHTKRSILKGRVYTENNFKLFSDSVITPSVDKIPPSAVNFGPKENKDCKMAQLGAEDNPYIMLYNDSDIEGMIVITLKKL